MPSPGSVTAAVRRGSPDRPTHEQQRQWHWQDSLRLRTRSRPDRPPPSPPSRERQDTDPLQHARRSDDDARWAGLRQGNERARAAGIAKAELECIRRAELRAAKAARSAAAVDDEDASSDTGAVPWITPRYGRGVGSSTLPDPDWDDLWDREVSAAAVAVSSPPKTSRERSRASAALPRAGGFSHTTAALLRARHGDARAPVPLIGSDAPRRSQREADRRKASLVALEKRVAKAEKMLERRERSSRLGSANMTASTPRRTRSAGENVRTSMAAIRRVAQSRIVAIELTEDGLKQEQLWFDRRRQVQQQQARPDSVEHVAGEPSGGPGGWLGSASLSGRVESERCSSLPHKSESGAASGESFASHTRVADEREQRETAVKHEPRGNSSDDDEDDIGSGDGLHVEPEILSSPRLNDLPLPEFVCPNGHELTAFETPIDGYKCDECGTIVAACYVMESCRMCEHDICKECIRSRVKRDLQQVGEIAVQRSMLDDVATMTKGTDGRGLQEFPVDLSSVLFEESAHGMPASDRRSGGRKRKQQARNSRVIEWSVALLILLYVAVVYVWRGTLGTPAADISTIQRNL